MTPLEAARHLGQYAEDRVDEHGYVWCSGALGCGEVIQYPHQIVGGSHRSNCLALVLPKIVAALEAAEDAVTAWENTRDGAPDYSVMSALRLAMRR